jgi:hypothetical protein
MTCLSVLTPRGGLCGAVACDVCLVRSPFCRASFGQYTVSLSSGVGTVPNSSVDFFCIFLLLAEELRTRVAHIRRSRLSDRTPYRSISRLASLASPPLPHPILARWARQTKNKAKSEMASSPATAAGPSSAVDLSAVDFDPRFEAFLAASADPGLPPDIAAQIGEGLRRQYAKPPVAQTEAGAYTRSHFHSFPFQLNLSSSVQRRTQLNS